MRTLLLAAFAAGITLASHAVAADVSISGTYRLVSEQRTIVDTGEVIAGTGARGYITYGDDGHMIVLIVRQPRPRPEGAEKTTDQQRIERFRPTPAPLQTATCSARSPLMRGPTSSTAAPSSTTSRSQ